MPATQMSQLEPPANQKWLHVAPPEGQWLDGWRLTTPEANGSAIMNLTDQVQSSTTTPGGAQDSPSRPERRGELDVMGMLIVFGLVFFHTAQIFGRFNFYVMHESTSMVAMFVLAFASLWGMPLMFLFAGIAIQYSLRRRTPGEFLVQRVKRLLVPFITGLLLFMPPQVYFGLKANPAYQEGYLRFYPRFFNVSFALSEFPLFLRGAPPDELFQINYLYFLIYLLVYTLILLPPFLYLRGVAGQRLVERWSVFFTRRWAIYLLALPIALIEAALATDYPGAWSRFVWILFIVYGYLSAADARFGEAMREHRKSALALGVVTFVIYFGTVGMIAQSGDIDPFTDYGTASVSARFIKGLCSWFWVVAIMGVAGQMSQSSARKRGATEVDRDADRQLSLMDRVGAYARDARLPFYVIHQMPVVLIGFYVVQWRTSSPVQYLVITLSSIVVTLVLYDVGVRRTRLTRFLFGVRER
jgi:hypothetical protein